MTEHEFEGLSHISTIWRDHVAQLSLIFPHLFLTSLFKLLTFGQYSAQLHCRILYLFTLVVRIRIAFRN